MGRCPFHDDQGLSLVVTPGKNLEKKAKQFNGGDVESEFYKIVKSNGRVDFKNNFRGKADAAMLGRAGNFAHYAIGSDFFSRFELDVGAGFYGVSSALRGRKPWASLTGPMFSDASAASVRSDALAANGCKERQ